MIIQRYEEIVLQYFRILNFWWPFQKTGKGFFKTLQINNQGIVLIPGEGYSSECWVHSCQG